ncbi:polyhomeotic-like protein 1 [Bombyx mori]|uniref:CCHC-type domain-containing protein n=1 Tax=Bombyx mori TaxID=7091 RepID=A0A8R2LVM0_BOMMO|nr:polyhomeotic-like protein 1 [Bombyx mori]
MSSLQRVIPQEGTRQAGESLRTTDSSVVRSPSYSGGGTNCTEIRSGKDGVKKGAGSLKDISRKNESAKDVVATGSVKDSEGRSSGTALVSDDSMATAGSAHSSARSSPTRRQRKRVLTISSDELGSSSSSDGAASTGKGGVMPQSKRGRGRLPTTGLTVDKQTCLKTQRSEIKATGSMSSMREVRSAKATEGSSKKDPECRLKESAAMALKVCSKPDNLKSTYQRALKELAVTIMEVTEELANRPATQETERLRAVNAGQQEEILQLRQELQEVRKELARISRALTLSNPVETPAPASSNTTEDQEELRVQRIMRAVGIMVDARFASLEMRLPPEPRIRPPLAADRRKTCEKSPDPPLIVDATLESTSVQAALPPSANKKTQGPRRKTTVLAPLSELGAFPPAPVVLTESWSTVTRRGAKSRGKVVRTAAAVPPEEKAPSSKKRTKKRLRAPRSQAVVLKLQPEAASRGLTYRSVLAEARAKIDLESLGIPVQRIRSSLTGAKVLVVDGGDQVEKADLLANRLKEILPAEGVEISRPSVTAAMRISGLDDSVSREEITDELAKIGGCPSESIKVGEIKSGPGGMGQVLVRCPVSTAAKIAAVPKLRIGWSVLRAHLLEARRLQCFRCHELGHVSARCPSSVDRSRDCYRCGQAGYVASGCSLAPHCTVCVSAGRPADHVSGGKACAKPPRQRQRRQDFATLESARSRPGMASATPMDAQS